LLLPQAAQLYLAESAAMPSRVELLSKRVLGRRLAPASMRLLINGLFPWPPPGETENEAKLEKAKVSPHFVKICSGMAEGALEAESMATEAHPPSKQVGSTKDADVAHMASPSRPFFVAKWLRTRYVRGMLFIVPVFTVLFVFSSSLYAGLSKYHTRLLATADGECVSA